MKKKFSYPTKIAVGYGLFMFINNLVKITIYPYIVIQSHTIGTEILLILLASMLIRLVMIFTYDKVKIDCFLIEELKNNQEKRGNNKITKRIKKLREIGKISLMIGLVIADPVITALFYRPESFQWNGLRGNKTKILFVMSNLFGALTVSLGINLLLFLLKKAGLY